MPNSNDTHQVIEETTAEFIQRYVSINIATRNSENRPMVARAHGCSVSPARDCVTIYLGKTFNQAALDNLLENQHLAVVFSRPSTHQTIQLKGRNAKARPLTADDHEHMRAYIASFKQEIASIGFPQAFCEAIVPAPDETFVAIEFAPLLAFSQTPGPNAGKQL